MEGRYEIDVSEVRNVACKTEYEDTFSQRWERVRGEVVGVGGGMEKV